MTDLEVQARQAIDSWALEAAEALRKSEGGILAAQQPVRYLGNASANSYRGPSPVIWAGSQPGGSPSPNSWIEDILVDPAVGMHFYDDFLVIGSGPAAATALTGSIGQWALYQSSAGGNIQDGGIIGGGILFNPGSIAVSSGTSTPTTALSALAGSFQITSTSTGTAGLQGKLAFECRVALTSITSGQRDAFIGLADQNSPQSNNPFTVVSGGSSQMLTTTRNLIGFYNADSGRGQDWAFVFQLASTAPVFPTSLNSLVSTVLGSAIVAGTYYKLGFIYDPNAQTETIGTASTGQTAGTTAKAMIKVYVNGVQAAAFLTQAANILTASFPTGIMGPNMAFANVSNSGTSNSGTAIAGQMIVDFIRVAQVALT